MSADPRTGAAAQAPHAGPAPWSLVVPVKALPDAKSRLGPSLDPGRRRGLVLAMLSAVLDACRAAALVERTAVVTADPEVVAHARAHGAAHVPDRVPAGHPDPLNAALRAALPARPRRPVGVVTADLPELGPELLDTVLREAARHPHSVLPDHTGVGTTMAFWTPRAGGVHPRFGPGSAAAHVELGGAVDLAPVLGDVLGSALGAARRDVDTPADVARLGPRTVLATPGPAPASDGGQWRA